MPLVESKHLYVFNVPNFGTICVIGCETETTDDNQISIKRAHFVKYGPFTDELGLLIEYCSSHTLEEVFNATHTENKFNGMGEVVKTLNIPCFVYTDDFITNREFFLMKIKLIFKES